MFPAGDVPGGCSPGLSVHNWRTVCSAAVRFTHIIPYAPTLAGHRAELPRNLMTMVPGSVCNGPMRREVGYCRFLSSVLVFRWEVSLMPVQSSCDDMRPYPPKCLFHSVSDIFEVYMGSFSGVTTKTWLKCSSTRSGKGLHSIWQYKVKQCLDISLK